MRDYSTIFIDFFITHIIGICIIFFASQNLHILSRNFSMNTHFLLYCILYHLCVFFVILFFFSICSHLFYIYEDYPTYIYFVLLVYKKKKNFHPRPIIDLRNSFLLISYLMNSISSNTVTSIAHQKYYLIIQNVFFKGNHEHFNFVVNIILKVHRERFMKMNQILFQTK